MKLKLYLSSEINGDDIGTQLFQIANVVKYEKESKKNNIKRKIIFKKTDNHNWDKMFKGIFKLYNNESFNNIKFEFSDIDNITSLNNIFLTNKYEEYDDNIRDKMIRIIYNNEDLMYDAYYKYRDILDYYGEKTKDDELVALYFDNDIEIDYYVKALDCININNLVIFCKNKEECIYKLSRDKYNIYYVENMNEDSEIILYSMFQHNIISRSYICLWASYISHYDNKIVISPRNNIHHKNITKYI